MIDKQLFIDTFKAFDKEVVIEIINIFFEEYPERFSKMDKNIVDFNFKELAFNAHSLKGVVSNFAAPTLFELAREVENISATLRDNENNPDLKEKLLSTYPKMKDATAELYSDLKEMLKFYI
jgi:HPt (histidine-containing phosphotransfer) domain-containing protein